MSEKISAKIDAILAEANKVSEERPRVLAGRVVGRSDDWIQVAVASGIVQVPLESIRDLESYGDAGHVRVQVSDAAAITPLGGPCGGPGGTRPPLGWPPVPDPVGPRVTPGAVGTMSDGTYTRYCEDTHTITYGITADATDDSWCGDDLDDWE